MPSWERAYIISHGRQHLFVCTLAAPARPRLTTLYYLQTHNLTIRLYNMLKFYMARAKPRSSPSIDYQVTEEQGDNATSRTPRRSTLPS